MYIKAGQFVCRGFTLLELLLTLLIVGLITAITPPLFSNIVPGVRFEQTVIDLQSTLRQARSLAITSSKEVVVSFDLNLRSYTTGDDEREDLPSDITLSVNQSDHRFGESSGKLRIRFFPDGSSTGSVIKLTSDDRIAELEIAWLTGKVSLRLGVQNAN